MRLCVLGNGDNIHTRRWVGAARAAGHSVLVVSFTPAVYENGTAVVIAGMSLQRFPLEFPAVLRAIRRYKPDLIHAHQVTSPGLYGVLAGRMLGVPCVVSAWGTDVLGRAQQPGVLQQITKYVLRKAGAVTSDSEYMSSVIQRWAPRTRLLTVPLGIEQSVIDRIQASREQKERIILSPRQHTPLYRIDMIIAACASVLPEDPSWSLVVAGGGSETERLKALAESLGIGGRVTFTGLVPRDELLRLSQRASVCVSVPTHDATSVSLLEAMASGCIPVVSDLPANREWVNNAENGFIVTDLPSLTDVVRQLVQLDEPSVSVMRRRNQSEIARRAVFEQNMQQVEALYAELLGR